MKYIEQLKKSYEEAMAFNDCCPESRSEFVGNYVFGFTTYDSDKGSALESLTNDMLEVLKVILEKRNFEYLENEDNYMKYMTMVNMPFLIDKLQWGTSIRGAWLDDCNKKFELDCGRIVIEEKELNTFIEQLFEFLTQTK